MGDMDDIVKDFLVESYENLDKLDRDFVALETDPTAGDKLGSIFRTIHTIKGTCGCLGLSKLEAVAHVGENLLSRLRDGQLIMDTEITTGLLKLVDAVREILGCIENNGNEGDKEYADIRAELIRLNERPSNAPGSAVESRPVVAAASAAPNAPAAAPAQASLTGASAASENCAGSNPSDASATIAPDITDSSPATANQTSSAEIHAETSAIDLTADASADHAADAVHDAPAAAKETKDSKDSLAANAIRVDVILLDKLMNLVGELVLARNQVLQYTAGQKDVALLRTAQRLNLITTELQEGVMKTRMQTIGNLWNKFPRIVRDVANSCGKKVRIEMEGRDTELDKTIIEAIKDPLTHVIRNSVDHGVESPEKRVKLGKPEEGRLFMRAFHEGGQVNIEISDDGKGIDPEIIKRKAVERGLITIDQSARMSEREAVSLVFLPGFSTAEKVTNVSGRGVGMDVVKTNIERIGGTVDIKSRVGEGTAIRIKIPLTLAIIPALVVTSGGERFAIPQVSLLELVRIDEDDSGIEMINGTPLYRLRGNLLPLVYLNKELKIEQVASATDEKAARSANIVVLRGGERQFGLVVDQINDTEEIVVKPLGKQLKGITVLAGATIMGDGKVALILDVMGLAQKANVISNGSDAATRNAAERAGAGQTDLQTLLLFTLVGGRRMAIPLSVVARLEEFPVSVVEDAGGQPVVQYRSQIMPLINVAGALKEPGRISHEGGSSGESTIQVVVYTHENRNVGLRVERIVDVVEERVVLRKTAARPGVLGTAIIKEKVTEMLDIASVVRGALASETAIERKAA
jgi:two-component system chemotaxis sensor kinase CheA